MLILRLAMKIITKSSFDEVPEVLCMDPDEIVVV